MTMTVGCVPGMWLFMQCRSACAAWYNAVCRPYVRIGVLLVCLPSFHPSFNCYGLPSFISSFLPSFFASFLSSVRLSGRSCFLPSFHPLNQPADLAFLHPFANCARFAHAGLGLCGIARIVATGACGWQPRRGRAASPSYMGNHNTWNTHIGSLAGGDNPLSIIWWHGLCQCSCLQHCVGCAVPGHILGLAASVWAQACLSADLPACMYACM